jgi:hypothetical protein
MEIKSYNPIEFWDKLSINSLVEVCTGKIDFSNSKIGNQNQGVTTKYGDTNDSKVISEYLKVLINDLKKYGDIKVAVKEYQVNFEKLQKKSIILINKSNIVSTIYKQYSLL